MAAAIDVHGLNKSFGDKHVVQDVSLTVEEGRVTGFLGPNGSGKTTTMRMVCGLLQPDSGSGTCLGYDILTESRQIKRHTGYMTQKFSLYEDLTIAENLLFVARIYGMDRRAERVDKALEGLGLTGRRDQLAGTLSGGWKQRLALAAAVLHEPKLLLLDEPTSSLDTQSRDDVTTMLAELADSIECTVVATHDMQLVAEWASRVLVLDGGKVLADVTPRELFADAALLERVRLRPPQIAVVGRELGLDSVPLSVAELVDAVRSAELVGVSAEAVVGASAAVTGPARPELEVV